MNDNERSLLIENERLRAEVEKYHSYHLADLEREKKLKAELAQVREERDETEEQVAVLGQLIVRYREALERIARPPQRRTYPADLRRLARVALTGETEPPFDREMDQ